MNQKFHVIIRGEKQSERVVCSLFWESDMKSGLVVYDSIHLVINAESQSMFHKMMLKAKLGNQAFAILILKQNSRSNKKVSPNVKLDFDYEKKKIRWLSRSISKSLCYK
ncbi:hypothetical protein L6164_003772 [Bauhinia variegata]|uniref:Uncharacterized protein n=1 Tax=Bauhinia variegata TaxID=167791 RepID=A0ACB9Q2E6_BAUVA|nr:hypothetical protein L6164_003772 [Bauhinia variegata]